MFSPRICYLRNTSYQTVLCRNVFFRHIHCISFKVGVLCSCSIFSIWSEILLLFTHKGYVRSMQQCTQSSHYLTYFYPLMHPQSTFHLAVSFNHLLNSHFIVNFHVPSNTENEPCAPSHLLPIKPKPHWIWMK